MVNLLQIFFSLTNTRHVWGPHPSYYQPSMAITAGSPLPSNRPVRHKRKNTQWTKGLQTLLLMLKNFVLETGRTWTIKRLSPLPVAANFGKLTHWSCSCIYSATSGCAGLHHSLILCTLYPKFCVCAWHKLEIWVGAGGQKYEYCE